MSEELSTRPTVTPKIELTDLELKSLIDSCWCRESDDPEFARILSEPRERLVNVLSSAQTTSNVNADSAKMPTYEESSRALKYTYLLAWLGEDYEANTQRIVRTVTNTTDEHLRGNAVGYLGILIRKGDKRLFRHIFELAPRSDAGVSTEIVEILRREIVDSTDAVLAQLAEQPEPNQTAVISLVSNIDEQGKIECREKIRAAGSKNRNLEVLTNKMLKAIN